MPTYYEPLVDTQALSANALNKRLAALDQGISAAVRVPAGAIVVAASLLIPNGWLVCDGAAVSRSTYSDLFTAIGTAFGSGDGSTTFNLPDLRGRIPIGAGQGAGLTNRTLGETVGTETHQLTTAQIPAHTHTARATLANTTAAGTAQNDPVGSTSSADNGGNGTHNNMQPTLVLNYIIKV